MNVAASEQRLSLSGTAPRPQVVLPRRSLSAQQQRGVQCSSAKEGVVNSLLQPQSRAGPGVPQAVARFVGGPTSFPPQAPSLPRSKSAAPPQPVSAGIQAPQQQRQRQQPIEQQPVSTPGQAPPQGAPSASAPPQATQQQQAATQQQQQEQQPRPLLPSTSSSWDEPAEAVNGGGSPQQPEQADMLRADDAWEAFEARLEADLATTGTTLVAILGVIMFWRGTWSLLDYYLGDNPIGDLACILGGFAIILYIRLAGLKVGSFWPSS